jgi:hypothetical protein
MGFLAVRRYELASAHRSAPSAPFFFGCGVRLSNFRLLTPLLLPLGGLPTAHQHLARRVSAVPLVPSPGLIGVLTTSAQAHPPTKATAAGRMQLTETMLHMSQGRACSRKGRPRDRLNLSGTFRFLRFFAATRRDGRKPEFTSGVLPDYPASRPACRFRRRTPAVRLPDQPTKNADHDAQRGREGYKEGDGVDLHLPSKEKREGHGEVDLSRAAH